MSGPLASDAFYNVAPMSEPAFGGGGGSLSPFQQMQQNFQSTMQNMHNDPFPLLEQYLGRQAQNNIEQTLQPMQQQAQEKISGVMSGIRSLVSEAFPNSGGMSTTGQLGFGGGSNQITQPTSPAPFTPAISPSDMGYPAPKIGTMGGMGNFGSDLSQIDLSHISTPAPLSGDPTAPLLGGGGKPMVGGSGMGNPMALSGPPPTTGLPAPAVGLKAFLTSIQNKTPLSVPATPLNQGNMDLGPPATPTTGPPAGFEKTKGVIDVGTGWTQNGQDYTKQINPWTGQPEVLMVDDIQKQKLLKGENIFAPPKEAPPSVLTEPSMLPPSILQPPDPNNPLFTPPMATIDPAFEMTAIDPSDPASPAYNPAMEYNLQAPLPSPTVSEAQQQALQQLWNSNMESSPFD